MIIDSIQRAKRTSAQPTKGARRPISDLVAPAVFRCCVNGAGKYGG